VAAVELAKKVVKLCSKPSQLKPIYTLNEKIEDKIKKICKMCYGASGVEFSGETQKKLVEFNDREAFVCMAKTPVSLTDDDKILVIDKPFKIHVKDLLIANGANFIIVLTGNIFRMPGLPKIPEANNM
jgi:formate--tetrahydrofolate ligase